MSTTSRKRRRQIDKRRQRREERYRMIIPVLRRVAEFKRRIREHARLATYPRFLFNEMAPVFVNGWKTL
jgi:hypothetical protein